MEEFGFRVEKEIAEVDEEVDKRANRLPPGEGNWCDGVVSHLPQPIQTPPSYPYLLNSQGPTKRFPAGFRLLSPTVY